MKAVVFVHEVAQVESLLSFIEKNAGITVVACGADIEFLLEAKGIIFLSARSLRTFSTPERLTMAVTLGKSLLESETMSFFSHRAIHIGQLYRPSFQYFIGNFLYAIDIVSTALEERYEKVYVFNTTVATAPAGAILGTYNSRIFPDAVSLVCHQQNLPFIELPVDKTRARLRDCLQVWLFKYKRSLFGVAMSMLNFVVRTTVIRKKIRIIASEYWKNIEPLMNELTEGEVILFDRTESLKIGIRNIFKHRMQFMHSDLFLTKGMCRIAQEKQIDLKKEWEKKYSYPLLSTASFKQYSLTPVFTPVMDHLVRVSESVVQNIESTWSMFERLKPELVLVRAGLSGQTHFATMCEVARLQSVPSLEVQHGILSVFSGDFTKDPSSEYIAEYGPIVREELSAHHFADRSTFLDIGSPRFDVYQGTQGKRKPMEDGIFHVLHMGPPLLAGDWNDSYDAFDFFTSIANAIRDIPHVHVTIKLRSAGTNEVFFREVIRRVFGNISYAVETTRPLHELIPKSDVVVSSHSTVVLEALLVGKPVIVDASLPIYAALADADLDRFKEERALTITKTQQELTDSLKLLSQNPVECENFSRRALAFMKKHYLLSDGKSSERLADTIRSLAKTH